MTVWFVFPALVVALFLAAVAWAVVDVLRTPRRPEHQRSKRLRDPFIDAFRGSDGA